jgi:hypothetical protein
MLRLSAAASAFVVLGLLASNPAQAVQRVFVASYGNDANTATNCGFANPCRGFTAAMTVVDPGGEVLALDAAGYGTVTITKSVSLVANPGVYAGISVAAGDGVTIATAGVNVTLRGLNINGTGGTNGITMTNGAKLSIENCVIANFTGMGVNVTTAATVRIIDSLIRDNQYGVYLIGNAAGDISATRILNNSGVGVWILANVVGGTTSVTINNSHVTGGNTGVNSSGANPTGTARMAVTNSTISHSLYGVVVNSVVGIGVVTVGNSTIANNGTGFYSSGTGTTLETLGNNTVRLNNNNATGTITAVSPM